MNQDLSLLQPYPFEKLAQLKQGSQPPEHLDHIALSIGEPRHPSPQFVVENLIQHLHQLSIYPSTRGNNELREAIAVWLAMRFNIEQKLIDPEINLLPVSGTREALFAIAQCVVDRRASNPLVFMPNPFYQIYEGAAVLAGASPGYLDCVPANGLLPDLERISAQQWADCQMIYVCNPGNPTGTVMSTQYLQQLIDLAHQYDFVIASDECYSEIFFDEDNPPQGLLGAAAEMGNDSFRHCLAFHSLSKRSNLPGLRSGFVAGDARIVKKFLLYRTYHGCAMSIPNQIASIAAWNDERHVEENRRLYTQKFNAVLEILSPVMDVKQSDASFYLWAKTPINEEEFAQRLFAEQQVTVLPGSYLSRTIDGINPGEGRIRMALVAEVDECIEAAKRIRSLIESL